MNSVSESLVVLASREFWQAAVIFLRVAAIVSVLPAFGERTVPVRVKLAIAIAFTLITASAAPDSQIPQGGFQISRFVAAETAIGLAMGISVRLFVLALQTAGAICAQSTSLSQILGGAQVEPIPAIGYFLVISGIAFAVMMNLHVHVAKLILGSYEVFPAGQFPDARILTYWGLTQVSQAFVLAFRLAVPFVIVSLIYNLALGVINRAMPQLMVAFVGAPVITLGGLFLLFAASPLMLHVWFELLMGFLLDPMGAR